MVGRIQSPVMYLRLIRAISLLMPGRFRSEWRREWEAEIVSRWFILKEWERLNKHRKLDLLKRVQGRILDALWFRQSRTRLTLVALNMLVALLTGFGALQEFIVGGIRYRQLQPFLISLAGIIVSTLFIISGIALLR